MSPPVCELQHTTNCSHQRISGFIFFFTFYISFYKICFKPPLISSRFYFISTWAEATFFGRAGKQEAQRAVKDVSLAQCHRVAQDRWQGTYSHRETQGPTGTVMLHPALPLKAQVRRMLKGDCSKRQGKERHGGC